MTIRFVYQIEGPSPPEKEGFGYWGFSVMLDRGFAMKLRGIEMDERNRIRFDKEGRDMIVKYGLEDRGMVTPYRFVEDSWLADGIVVPGILVT